MTSPKVENIWHDYGDFPFKILAYRVLTDQERQQIVDDYRKQHPNETQDADEIITIETEIR